MIGIARNIFTNRVRASAGKAGIAGVVAGFAFNMLLRRSPVGALALGAAILAHRAYKAGQTAQAERDARKARKMGQLKVAPPPQPVVPTTPEAPTPLPATL